MEFKFPEDDPRYQWTDHVKGKMVYYGISESLIKRIVRAPGRIEEGVAPETTAVMQSRKIATRSRGKPGKKVEEIWVMYQELGKRPSSNSQFSRPPSSCRRQVGQAISNFQIKKRIISAWRYPGVSPIGKKIPIPDEVMIDLENALQEKY